MCAGLAFLSSISGCAPQSKSKYFVPAGKLNYFYSEGHISGQKAFPLVPLADGRIIVLGGVNWDNSGPVGDAFIYGRPVLRKAEIYDPVNKGSVAFTDSPYDLFDKQVQAFLLPDSQIMITGPDIGNCYSDVPDPSNWKLGKPVPKEYREGCLRTTALRISLESMKYTPLLNMRPVRQGGSITVLEDGRVLLLGGDQGNKESSLLKAETHEPQTKISVEDQKRKVKEYRKRFRLVQIFDPKNDSISVVAELPYYGLLCGHSATCFGKDQILITGGFTQFYRKNFPDEREGDNLVSDILVFDVSKRQFQKVGNLLFPRIMHSVVPLDNKRFLIVGGTNPQVKDKGSGINRVDELEVFDLKTGLSKDVGTFSAGTPVFPVSLPDHRILLVGGTSVGIFDPKTDSLRKIDELIQDRKEFFVVSNANQEVFVIGGINLKTRRMDQTVERFDYKLFLRKGELR